jgi:hypothetical protein
MGCERIFTLFSPFPAFLLKLVWLSSAFRKWFKPIVVTRFHYLTVKRFVEWISFQRGGRKLTFQTNYPPHRKDLEHLKGIRPTILTLVYKVPTLGFRDAHLKYDKYHGDASVPLLSVTQIPPKLSGQKARWSFLWRWQLACIPCFSRFNFDHKIDFQRDFIKRNSRTVTDKKGESRPVLMRMPNSKDLAEYTKARPTTFPPFDYIRLCCNVGEAFQPRRDHVDRYQPNPVWNPPTLTKEGKPQAQKTPSVDHWNWFKRQYLTIGKSRYEALLSLTNWFRQVNPGLLKLFPRRRAEGKDYF